MFRSSSNYYERGEGFMSFVGWLIDVLFGIGAFIVGAIFVISAVVTGVVWIFAGPECRARGEKMGLQVDWAFSQGCMINLKSQWLPWSEVVPVERNGKIEFTVKASSK